MISIVFSLIAALGVYLIFTSFAYKNQTRPNQTPTNHRLLPNSKKHIDEWMAQAGLADVDHKQFVALLIGLFIAGSSVAWLLFGGFIAPVISGIFAASFLLASYRQRRARRRGTAAEAWPRLIEETRLLCGSLGRPIPQALWEVGKHGPEDLRSAFSAAEREWLISTDFSRSIAVLKDRLADPTADATCETLLVAHAVGGSDIDHRLAALAADRRTDLQSRKEARAKQAGVRFARRFVLVVPVGMALSGMSIGNGRMAYATTTGQIGVAIGLLTLAGCWWWAGKLIQLPEEERVFRA